jgi:N-acyl-D-aspartate/D-glutamate deacylase
MLSAAVMLVLACTPAADPPPEADYVIKNVLLCDGTGRPAQRGVDVVIKGDKVLMLVLGDARTGGRPKVIDGSGLVAAPGFIDLHTHSDNGIQEPATRANLNYLLQGVTTAVTGNCGFGPVDAAGYLKKIDEGGAGTNVIHQVPHNDLRQAVMGNADRPPTDDEVRKMKALVEQGMKDGAWGLSTGLWYNPGTYAKTEEIIELAKVAAAHGGFYASHMRDEGPALLEAVEETLRIGREAKLPVHISHIKAYGKTGWGKAGDAIALIEAARKKGQAVTADQYPYTASSTSIGAVLIPARFREGTQKELAARFDDPEVGTKMRQAVEAELKSWDDGKLIRIGRFVKRPEWQGKDVAAVAAAEKKSPLEVVIEIERGGGAHVVNFSMREEEVRLYMKQPWVATASDGGAMVPSDEVPHPRSYGCFARKVGRYAVEEKVVSLEQAVRSCSGLPADILGLKDRGYLKPDAVADLVVFDPETFRDTATFDAPHRYAVGVKYVFVNGRPAVWEGRFTGELAGRALRHGR